MKKCRDIENLLPLLDSEGALSDAEKHDVEEHLAACASCRKERAYLQKAGRLVRRLPDVLEPPWFQQKIMAEVRKEAEKKTLAQKWFYPLRIKIPLQVMATLVIAVLAVYIYRSGDEEAGKIVPGMRSPSVEISRDQALPSRRPEVPAVSAPAAPDKKVIVREEIRRDQEPRKGMAETAGARQKTEPGIKAQSVFEKDAGRAGEAANRKEDRVPAHDAGPEGRMIAQPEAPPSVGAMPQEVKSALADRERKNEALLAEGSVKKKELAKTAAPRSMAASVAGPRPPDMVLKAADVSAALSHIEKWLAANEARILSRQASHGTMRLRIEMNSKYLENFLSTVKKIGQVQENVRPRDSEGRNVYITLEIKHLE